MKLIVAVLLIGFAFSRAPFASEGKELAQAIKKQKEDRVLQACLKTQVVKAMFEHIQKGRPDCTSWSVRLVGDEHPKKNVWIGWGDCEYVIKRSCSDSKLGSATVKITGCMEREDADPGIDTIEFSYSEK